MRGPQTVRKRALPLGSPHDSVDVIGAGIVLDQAGKEIPVVGIVDAQRLGIPPVQISLLHFLDVRQVGAKHVLKPADDFHAALFGGREHFGQDVQVAVVGRASVLENRVLVVLRMRRGEVSAVKIEVVLLLAVIGQRLARNLSSGDAATVGEYRKKQRIHAGAFLKHIEDFLGAFIHKRNCSHLDADHFGRRGSSVVPESAWPGRRRLQR